jgi:hypothetical protein
MSTPLPAIRAHRVGLLPEGNQKWLPFLYLWALKVKNMKQFIVSFKEKVAWVFLSIVGIWIICALLFQITMIGLEFGGYSEVATRIGNELMWKFDGTFKNSPGNIMYNAADHIYVEKVTNKVVIGKLAGNRNLEFGVKNILEEYLQDKGYDLSSDAEQKLKVEIIYLDVLTTKSNLSVFHKGEQEVVIRLKGILYKEGIKVKEVIVEESSSEISISTLIIDEGGKFNQTSLSNALKKGCDKLITKLFEK